MAEALKTKGIEELRAVRKRVIRQYGAGNISRADNDRLIGLLDEIEAHIVRMQEQIPARLRKRGF